MKRALFRIFALLVLAALGGAALALHQQRSFAETRFGGAGVRVVNIPQGTRPHALAKVLADSGVVSSAQRFYWHLHYFRRGLSPRAGEYEFAGSLTPDEVLQKLVKGEVKLYHFTVPEGLRVDEMASIVAQTGLCAAEPFLALARDGVAAHKAGLPGSSFEGFLFPDTYSVPRGAGCAGIIAAMVARFKVAWADAQSQRLPSVKLDQLQAITLASIVEKETGQPAERPHVSCVFHNRLKKKMRLATDPTVIYAVLLQNDFTWDGKIHKADLLRPHPYNTYLNQGLPPGPISNPGEEAMIAALHPLACDDLFFVSKNDHTTVFCPDYACHEKAVQKWQVDYFKRPRGG